MYAYAKSSAETQDPFTQSEPFDVKWLSLPVSSVVESHV